MTTSWIVAYVALAVTVLLLGLLELGTLRRVAETLERAELALSSHGITPGGLQPGQRVPPFAADLRNGTLLTSESLTGTAYLLVLTSSDCPACDQLLRELRASADFGVATLIVVSDFSDAPHVTDNEALTLVRQRGRSISRAFQTNATPYAFVVDSDGLVVDARIANSVVDLRDLVHEALGGSAQDLRRTTALG